MRRNDRLLLLVFLLLASASQAAAPPAGRVGVDDFGDPLPPDAVRRFGTTRLKHPLRIWSLAFAPDGKALFSADADGRVRHWDLANGKLLRDWGARTGSTLALSADGKRLAAGGWNNFPVSVWDAAGGNKIAAWTASSPALAFSPTGKELLGCGGNDVILWRSADGKELRRFVGLKNPVQSIAFSPDGKTVAAGDMARQGDSTILLWDAATGKERHRLIDPRQGYVTSLAFAPDGKTLAEATYSHVRLWEVETGKPLGTVDPGRTRRSVAFDASGQRLVTAGGVCLWDVSRRMVVRRLWRGYHSADLTVISPDGKIVAGVAAFDLGIRLWDADTGQEKLTGAGHPDEVSAAAFSPDGRFAATGSGGDSSVRLWDLTRGGAAVQTLRLRGRIGNSSRANGLTSLVFSPDGRSLMASGRWASARWDVVTGRELTPLPGAGNVAWSADGRVRANAADDEGVRLWDAAASAPLRQIAPQGEDNQRNAGRFAVALSPDGRTLATGSVSDQRDADLPPADSIQLWDVATGKRLRTMRPAHRAPASLAFSPDGTLLAAAETWDPPVELWNVAAGTLVYKLASNEKRRRHWSEARPLAFSPDGVLLASDGQNNTVVLWETATGQTVRVLAGHDRPCRALAFSPDGRMILSGGGDTTALLFPVAPPALLVEARRKWTARTGPALWNDLGAEAEVAFSAWWKLAAAPEQAVPFLKERLKPDPDPDPREVARLIVMLNDEKFAVREAAQKQLEQMGVGAAPVLRRTLSNAPSEEVKFRVEQLLNRVRDGEWSMEGRRDRRAIQAFGQMRTLAAEEFLEKLARGGPEGIRTRAAQSALLYLEARRQREKPGGLTATPRVALRGRALGKLFGHDGEVHKVAFAPDGRTLASAGRDGKIRRWNLTTGKERPALPGHQGGAFDLAFSPDGKRLASGGADGQVRIWNAATGREEAVLAGHKGAVFAVAFGPENCLASGGEDKTIRLRDVGGKREERLLRGVNDRVTALAFAADGRTLLAGGIGSAGNTFNGVFIPSYPPAPVRVWSVRTGQAARPFGQNGSVLSLSNDGKLLVVGVMQTGTVLNSDQEGPFTIASGDVVLTYAATGQVRLKLVGNGSLAALSPDNCFIATAGGSDFHIGGKTRPARGDGAKAGRLRLWEIASGSEVLQFESEAVTALAFAPDGKHLLTGGKTGEVLLWETAPPGVLGGKRTREALEGLWRDLASANGTIAYGAFMAIIAAGEQSPPFLAEMLRPAAADDAGLKRTIADLGAVRYVVRREAFAELVRRGAEVEPAVRAALGRTQPLPVKRRLEDLLAAPGVKVFPESLRRLRAVQILERIGSVSARQVLTALAAGPPGDPLSEEARASLLRLGKPRNVKP